MTLPGLSEVRAAVDQELRDFTQVQSLRLRAIDDHLAPVADALTEFITDGGKRFRPIFAYLGYLANGSLPSQRILSACSALELVHVCALIHDDLMDGSDSRRNRPSIHKKFEHLHENEKYDGNSKHFGLSAAILLGDLALSWSDQMIHISGVASLEHHEALDVFYEMRAELMAGQYLDVLEGAIAESDLNRSRKIARYKSGRYSIERPLRFGAALAGASNSLKDALSDFGLPLGEAFQLRDDILGVFGDSSVTGKPSGDDLKEGKRTVLIALTMKFLTEKGQTSALDQIERALGDSTLTPIQVAEIQKLIDDSGALARCEEMIEALLTQSLKALEHSEMNKSIASALTKMALAATKRES